MPRFFVNAEQITEESITVLGDDAHHISRSLRMAVGERITVCDALGMEYECELKEFLPDRVVARILSSQACKTEPPYRACVFQALPKGDKLDSIIQKAVECGACEIIPFESERCVARVKDGAEEKKTDRRTRIALEAAKQCGRGTLPKVSPTLSFDAALKLAKNADLALFCYEGDGTRPIPSVLRDWKQRQPTPNAQVSTIALMIGSEGGFSLKEKEKAVECGMIPIGLGKRILRTETAAAFVLACLSYELELS